MDVGPASRCGRRFVARGTTKVLDLFTYTGGFAAAPAVFGCAATRVLSATAVGFRAAASRCAQTKRDSITHRRVTWPEILIQVCLSNMNISFVYLFIQAAAEHT